MNKPVCLILGAGAGMVGHVAKRFAREGYHACLARRSDKAGLDPLVAEIEAEGGSATGFMLDAAVEDGSIEQRVQHIEADIGPIGVAVFNLGAQIGDLGLRHTAQDARPGALCRAARIKGAAARRPAVAAEVANTYFYLAHQHRSAWTFELDLRDHSDLAWWNHAPNPDLK